MARLCMLNDNGTVVQEWEIGDKPISVGRGALADVRVNDEGLSRRHFMIMQEGADCLVKDLSSRNGTWVNGSRMPESRLRDRDCIQAGRTQFRLSAPERGWPQPQRPQTPGARRLAGPHDTVIIQTDA